MPGLMFSMPLGAVDARAFEEWIAALAADTENPRHRRALEVMCEHWHYEVVELDLDKLMATLVPDPVYHFYGLAQMPRELRGAQAVRELYLQQFQAGPNAVSMELDHLIVTDSAVAFEGRSVMRLDSPLAAAFLGPLAGVDLERPGVFRLPNAAFLPFADGLIAGEVNYLGGPLSADQITYIDAYPPAPDWVSTSR